MVGSLVWFSFETPMVKCLPFDSYGFKMTGAIRMPPGTQPLLPPTSDSCAVASPACTFCGSTALESAGTTALESAGTTIRRTTIHRRPFLRTACSKRLDDQLRLQESTLGEKANGEVWFLFGKVSLADVHQALGLQQRDVHVGVHFCCFNEVC